MFRVSDVGFRVQGLGVFVPPKCNTRTSQDVVQKDSTELASGLKEYRGHNHTTAFFSRIRRLNRYGYIFSVLSVISLECSYTKPQSLNRLLLKCIVMLVTKYV